MVAARGAVISTAIICSLHSLILFYFITFCIVLVRWCVQYRINNIQKLYLFIPVTSSQNFPLKFSRQMHLKPSLLHGYSKQVPPFLHTIFEHIASWNEIMVKDHMIHITHVRLNTYFQGVQPRWGKDGVLCFTIIGIQFYNHRHSVSKCKLQSTFSPPFQLQLACIFSTIFR